MTAHCATCGTPFRIDESKLGERGAKVRCPRCGATVVVERAPAAPVPPRQTSAAAVDSTALDLDGLDRMSDDDIAFADAELVAEAASAENAGARATTTPAPPDSAPGQTRVGPPPNLARGAGSPSARPAAVPERSSVLPDHPGGAPVALTTPAVAQLPTRDLRPGEQDRAEAPVGPVSPALRSATARTRRSRRTVLSIAGTLLGTLLATAVFGLGMLVFLGGGRLDEQLLRLDREAIAAMWKGPAPVLFDGVQVTSMRSVSYPTRAGGWMLVFFGEVANRSQESKTHLHITAMVLDKAGRTLASEQAPVGVALGPAELLSADSPEALVALYRSRLDSDPQAAVLAPGGKAPYTVVLLRPPPLVERLQHTVRLVRIEAPMVLPPPSTPLSEESSTALAPQRRKAKAKAKAKSAGRRDEENAAP